MTKGIYAVIVGILVLTIGGWLSTRNDMPAAEPTNNVQTQLQNDENDLSDIQEDAETAETATVSDDGAILASDLERNDGVGNRACWVAVDGTVYEVPDGTNGWENGVHVASNGKMKCGLDGTDVINQSPHGKDVLSSLVKIGELAAKE